MMYMQHAFSKKNYESPRVILQRIFALAISI